MARWSVRNPFLFTNYWVGWVRHSGKAISNETITYNVNCFSSLIACYLVRLDKAFFRVLSKYFWAKVAQPLEKLVCTPMVLRLNFKKFHGDIPLLARHKFWLCRQQKCIVHTSLLVVTPVWQGRLSAAMLLIALVHWCCMAHCIRSRLIDARSNYRQAAFRSFQFSTRPSTRSPYWSTPACVPTRKAGYRLDDIEKDSFSL